MVEAAGADPSRPSSGYVGSKRLRSINVLTLCGLVLGVAAIFCTWTYTSSPSRLDFSYFTSYWPSSSHLLYGISSIGPWLFLLGTAFAVITPLAGLAQAAGLLAFAVSMLDGAALASDRSDGLISLGASIGFYVAVLSASVTILSLVHPIGPGFGPDKVELGRRLTVFYTGRTFKRRAYVYHGLRPRRMRMPSLGISGTGVRAAVSAHKKWFAMFAALLLVSLVLVLYENAFFMDRPPLDTIEGGVVLELSRDSPLFVGFLWDDSSVGVGTNGSHASWNLSVDGLDGGAWVAANVGSECIGPLNLSVTVVDLLGDGMSSQGDRLILTAQDGSSFVEDVVYGLSWRTVVGSPEETYYAEWSVGFMFHDGNLDSWVSSGTLWRSPWVIYY